MKKLLVCLCLVGLFSLTVVWAMGSRPAATNEFAEETSNVISQEVTNESSIETYDDYIDDQNDVMESPQTDSDYYYGGGVLMSQARREASLDDILEAERDSKEKRLKPKPWEYPYQDDVDDWAGSSDDEDSNGNY